MKTDGKDLKKMDTHAYKHTMMHTSMKHIFAGTVVCALTLVIFLAFYSRMPESVPVHFDSAGIANSYWPRNIVVFGVPAACVILNVAAGICLRKREEKKAGMFYVLPAAAVLVTAVMIFLGVN